MSLQLFQQQLELTVRAKLQLKITDNRSTMLSVRWEPDCTKVSLHRMFLQAPQNVMQELACYIRREDKVLAPSVKSFIDQNLKRLDYSHLVNPLKLNIQGNIYNLQQIFSRS